MNSHCDVCRSFCCGIIDIQCNIWFTSNIWHAFKTKKHLVLCFYLFSFQQSLEFLLHAWFNWLKATYNFWWNTIKLKALDSQLLHNFLPFPRPFNLPPPPGDTGLSRASCSDLSQEDHNHGQSLSQAIWRSGNFTNQSLVVLYRDPS